MKTENNSEGLDSKLEATKSRLLYLFDHLFEYDGFGHLELDMRLLKRGQKEVLIRCGREYRYVLDYCNPGKSNPISGSVKSNMKKTDDN